MVPSYYGVKENPNYDAEKLVDADSEESNEQYEYFFGDSAVSVPRAGVEIKTPFEDGRVIDWQAFQKLCEYCLIQILGSNAFENLAEMPILLTEQIWATDADREAAMEIAFKEWKVPAFYIIKVPVGAVFACGKGSALVVDIGAQFTTVTPVFDGLALFKVSRRSRHAGNYVDQHILDHLSKKGKKIVPWYLVSGKEAVVPGEEAKYTERSFDFPIPDSFHQYQLTRVVRDIKDEIGEVAETPLNDSTETSLKHYEFPDGSSIELEKERYDFFECLFRPVDYALDGEVFDKEEAADTGGKERSGSKSEDKKDKEQEITDSLIYTDRTTTNFSSKGISNLIVDTINACDVDIRPNLANNIIIVGSSSLALGMTDRINHDLTEALSGLKIRIYASGNTVERKFAAWIGGSILASLGTFHQLWISKKEYEESGAAKLLEKRFR